MNRVITAMTVKVTDDGWIYIGGDFMTAWGSRLPRLARLNPEVVSIVFAPNDDGPPWNPISRWAPSR